MAVTAIKSIRNDVDAVYAVKNNEHPSDTGGEGKALEIPPGVVVPCSMWIPWCGSQGDFDDNHFIIMSPVALDVEPVVFIIWQDGDYVRYSKDGLFHPNGNLVQGNNTVGGDRAIQIVGPNMFEADIIFY